MGHITPEMQAEINKHRAEHGDTIIDTVFDEMQGGLIGGAAGGVVGHIADKGLEALGVNNNKGIGKLLGAIVGGVVGYLVSESLKPTKQETKDKS